MPWHVVARRGRAGEDELPRQTSVVDGSTHRVPESWNPLPLVDEPRCWAGEDQSGIQRRGLFGARLVEQDLTGRPPPRGLRLSASLDTLDEDGAQADEA